METKSLGNILTLFLSQTTAQLAVII